MLRYLIFLYQWLILFPVLLTLTLLTALVTIVGSFLFNNRWWGFYPAKIWSMLTCYLAFCPVKVVGREHLVKGQSYIFASNHQGSFDIFVVYGFLNRNFRWIMKHELRRMPFVGKACQMAGHIFVDRTHVKSIRETMESAQKQLTNGMSIVIFPEGSRTLDGKIGRFKKGAFQIAVDLKLPVVPLTIDGAYDVMPRNSNILRPRKIVLTIHPPIEPKGNKGDALQSLLEDCHKSISSALPK